MKKSRAGFTLIEIMVVIIILATVAGMMVPNLHGSAETFRLKAASRRLGDLMDYCYHSAVATGRVHGLIFDEEKRRFEVLAEEKRDPNAPPQSEGQTALNPVSLPIALDRKMPEGVKIKSVDIFRESEDGEEENQDTDNLQQELRIFFFPDGSTEFATVELASINGERRQVVLNGLSGTVSMYIPRPEEDEEKESGGEGGQ